MRYKTLKFPEAVGDWTTYRPRDIKEKAPFKSISKSSAEDVNEFFFIHNLFFQHFFKTLESMLSLKISFLSLSAYELTYEQFLRNIKDPVMTGSMNLLGQPCFLTFDFKSADSILEAILGGEIKQLNTPRQFSELEIVSFKSFFESLLKNKNFPWTFLSFEYSLENFGSTKVFLNTETKTNEPIITFSASFSSEALNEGQILISYFSKGLKIILKNLQKLKRKTRGSLIQLEPDTLEKTFVPVTIDLTKTTIPAYELSQIRKGDVIDLKTKIGTYVKINLSDVSLFGICGQKENKLAVKIAAMQKVRELSPEEEFQEYEEIKISKPVEKNPEESNNYTEDKNEGLEEYEFDEEDVKEKDRAIEDAENEEKIDLEEDYLS